MEALFAEAFDRDLTTDGVLASSEIQRRDLWAMRENLPEANRRIGAIASHDISLPLEAIPGFVEDCPRALSKLGQFRYNIFGHLGDGNLHFNVFPAEGRTREDYPGMRDAISRIVHDMAMERDGSFSAEHGVGRFKVADLERYGDPAKLRAMKAIKSAIDPNGIMNPGAIFRM